MTDEQRRVIAPGVPHDECEHLGQYSIRGSGDTFYHCSRCDGWHRQVWLWNARLWCLDCLRSCRSDNKGEETGRLLVVNAALLARCRRRRAYWQAKGKG